MLLSSSPAVLGRHLQGYHQCHLPTRLPAQPTQQAVMDQGHVAGWILGSRVDVGVSECLVPACLLAGHGVDP